MFTIKHSYYIFKSNLFHVKPYIVNTGQILYNITSKHAYSVVSPVSLNISTTRALSNGPIRNRMSREEKLRNIDEVADNWNLIYKAPLDKYLKVTQAFATVTTAIVSSLALVKYSSNEFIQYPINIGIDTTIIATDWELAIYFVGFALINTAITALVMQFPVRIYNNQDKYVAVFHGILPFTKKKLAFEKGQVTQHKGLSILPWADLRYKINNSGVILLEDHFKSHADLNGMLKCESVDT